DYYCSSYAGSSTYVF
nr:immunoglobulin light chain junction region [Macaca mulatta]